MIDPAGQAQAPPPQYGGQPKNYYAGFNDSQGDNLKYRLDAKDAIRELCEQLAGHERDRTGRLETKNERMRLLNDEGIFRVKVFLQSACGKITHLTKYENEDRVLRQMRHHASPWLFTLVLNRKNWDIRDKETILFAGEKLMFESMLRAKEGFENNNISQTYIVNENIDRTGVPPPSMQRPGILSRWLGGSGGGR